MRRTSRNRSSPSLTARSLRTRLRAHPRAAARWMAPCPTRARRRRRDRTSSRPPRDRRAGPRRRAVGRSRSGAPSGGRLGGRRHHVRRSGRRAAGVEPEWFEGCTIAPGFVDCHTHLPFVGWRADEFEARLSGVSYRDLHGEGGIYRSAAPARRGVRRRGARVLPAAPAGDGRPRDDGARAEDRLRPVGRGRAPAGAPRPTAGRGGAADVHGHAARVPRRAEGDGARGLGPRRLRRARSRRPRPRASSTPSTSTSRTSRSRSTTCEAVAEAATAHGLPLRCHADQLGPSGAAEAAVGARRAERGPPEPRLGGRDRGPRAARRRPPPSLLPTSTLFLRSVAARRPSAARRRGGRRDRDRLQPRHVARRSRCPRRSPIAVLALRPDAARGARGRDGERRVGARALRRRTVPLRPGGAPTSWSWTARPSGRCRTGRATTPWYGPTSAARRVGGALRRLRCAPSRCSSSRCSLRSPPRPRRPRRRVTLEASATRIDDRRGRRRSRDASRPPRPASTVEILDATRRGRSRPRPTDAAGAFSARARARGHRHLPRGVLGDGRRATA